MVQGRTVYFLPIATLACLVLNVFLLVVLQTRILQQKDKQEWFEREDFLRQEAGQAVGGLVISFEEDGRFGNLLLETSTLLLVGRRVNRPVNLLPQVAKKLSKYFQSLPVESIDPRQHCVCTYCTECLCEYCAKWQKIPSYNFNNKTKLRSNYILLQWFDSNLVLSNIKELAALYRSILKPGLVSQVQDLLAGFTHPGSEETFVGVHVRRTDYVNWIERKYKGKTVDEKFFKHGMNYFRDRYSQVRFYVTSDDLQWCMEHLSAPDVVFPKFSQLADNTVEQDFILLTQMNHTIYDYGSFGFWAAAIAGGQTIVADNYSNITHPLLAAIRRHKPDTFHLADIQRI